MPISIPNNVKKPVQTAPVSSEEIEDTPAHDEPAVAPVEQGSVAARVLLDLWAGNHRGIVVSSPPGGGKTGLVSVVAANLFEFAELRIGVACNTAAQVAAVANRIAADSPDVPVRVIDSAAGSIQRSSLTGSVEYSSRFDNNTDKIMVATLSKWGASTGTCDVLIIDEAYQTTWGKLMQVGNVAQQFLLVGDPGQIPPICNVQTEMARFATMKANPTAPAPVALVAQRPKDVKEFTLDATRRLQPLSAQIISPFYGFEFGSTAHPASVVTDDGQIDEIARLTVDNPISPLDERLLELAADRIVELLSDATVTDRQGADYPVNVLAMAAHRNQVAGIHTRLRSRLSIEQRARLKVDTFDAVQGLEAHCSVVIDPMVGQMGYNDHSMEPGRLCVALSRHSAHMTFITSDSVDSVLGSEGGDRQIVLNRTVRNSIKSAAS